MPDNLQSQAYKLLDNLQSINYDLYDYVMTMMRWLMFIS